MKRSEHFTNLATRIAGLLARVQVLELWTIRDWLDPAYDEMISLARIALVEERAEELEVSGSGEVEG